ncbi:MAG: STAS domain-containing protein, partial [Candidatus Omnitrophota bacterium]
MPQEKLTFDYSAVGTLCLKISQDWQIASVIPSFDEVILQLNSHSDVTQVTFDTAGLGVWDSGLTAFLLKLIKEGARRNIRVVPDGLPKGVQR